MKKSLRKTLFLLIFTLTCSLQAQVKTVTGTITDAETGIPIPGASVLVTGTTVGTATDFDGKFSVSTETNATLIVSYLGYGTVEVPVAGRNDLSIQLTAVSSELDEVVVVGYGTQKKTNVTSAISSVDGEELSKSSVANISNALVGRLPGLIATQRSGQPGDNGSNLLIRGISTTGNSAPLVIVDGVQRGFSQLDPNTIESVTILKDASAAAVYGVRGGNGVILVTTKRGKTGKPTITYTSEITTNMPTARPKYLGSYQYALLFNESRKNAGLVEPFSSATLEAFRTGSDPILFPDTDWLAEFTAKNAFQQQHNMTISGGSAKVNYFVSGGFLKEDGLIPNVSFKRSDFRSNLDYQITDNLKISLDLSGRQEERILPASNANTTSPDDFYWNVARESPTSTAYYPNGLPGPGGLGGNNIEQIRNGGTNTGIRNIFLGNMNFEYKIPKIDGLVLKGYMAIDWMFSTNKVVNKFNYFYRFDPNTGEYNRFEQGQSRVIQTYFQGPPPSDSGVANPTKTYNATLNYNKTFAGKHYFTGLLGVEKATHQSFGFRAERQNLVSESLPELDFADAGTSQNGGNAFNAARLGYLARVTYSYDTKYLLEGSFRYDASENFAKENRWGFFPSFSAGWRISKEKFMDDINFINELKIRGSWGRLGNDRIGQFQFLDTFDFSGSYILGGAPVQTIRPGVIPNVDLTWETATIRDIGFDMEVMERKLGIEFDYFTKTTKDILEAPTRVVPDFVGAALPQENFGIVDNKGFEASLTYRNNIDKFNYWVKANYTHSENTIIEIGEPAAVTENLKITGRSIGSTFGLIADGLFQSQAEIDGHADQSGFGIIAPGDIKYKDINGDDIINNDDRDFIGVLSSPNTIYSLSFGGSYGNFDISAQLQGASDFNIYLSGQAAFAFAQSGPALARHLGRWTPDNTDAKLPRVLPEGGGNNSLQSSFWIQNASYLRVKNVEIGYNIPMSLLSKLKLDQLRLFASGLNLLTISDIENFDPEAPSGNGGYYPQTRSFTLGLKVGF